MNEAERRRWWISRHEAVVAQGDASSLDYHRGGGCPICRALRATDLNKEKRAYDPETRTLDPVVVYENLLAKRSADPDFYDRDCTECGGPHEAHRAGVRGKHGEGTPVCAHCSDPLRALHAFQQSTLPVGQGPGRASPTANDGKTGTSDRTSAAPDFHDEHDRPMR